MKLALPLRILVLEECVKVVDRLGKAAAYLYFSDDPERRQQTGRWSREEAVALAQVAARAWTEKAEKQE